ncbi:NADPH-dependent curcumin reductase CurA [Bacillus mesophilus]|uniref:NADP-dependent oxidoreductase n=1 Tax=Bacillus mesophilus TaxID=1808955 RepID=A0A6M0Q8G5_9BACI|nr:NADP-dependent oxidoreductase [Bacillus mesophilus]MBM7662072.1 NADPH-dependent curcumin reductase CurA [Bacillus mesophilus]NEY72573.1 NADP-dependent oxidoreductase [Bacillus mesophilus]
MTVGTSRKILLANRPKGMPNESNFKIIEERIPEIKSGEVLIKSLYISVDPYMRGRMSDAKSYAQPYKVGEPFVGGIVGKIVESKNDKYQEGGYIEGRLDWAEFNVSDGSNIRRLDPELAPISTSLHVLGMPGLTAYFGLLHIGQPKEGETVVVSGASGAVGTIVGQIAKLKGCRVVGIAGGEEKCAFLTDELGFDAAINYKSTSNLREALKEACPNGVDVYFDNVGGDVSDAVLTLINFQARIVICGQISQYNLEKPELGPRVAGQLLTKSALMKGFIVSDYAPHNKEGLTQLTKWIKDGHIQYRENMVEGFENAVDAFLGLFRGDNIGKQLVKIADE